MRIGILLVRHPSDRPSPIVPEMVALLRGWGAGVDLLYVDETSYDVATVTADCDLYVHKSGTETALSVAGLLHAAGAALLNPYPVAAVCRDKIVTTGVLAAAGVPVPQSWVAGRAEELASALAGGPLVLKPHRGSQGRGVVVIDNDASLAVLARVPGPLFAQRYVPHDGPDHKLYCIGGRVFGVRRVFPARTLAEKLGEPFSVSPYLHDLVLRVGTVFGIDLFGVDVVISDGQPFVVDMSSFPGFKGVPDAALRLAEYVYAAARRAARGEPVTSDGTAFSPAIGGVS